MQGFWKSLEIMTSTSKWLFTCYVNKTDWEGFFQLITSIDSKVRESGVHSRSWKFSLHIVYIFRVARKILIKFLSSDHSSNRNILTPLRLSFEISARAHVAIVCEFLDITWSWNIRDALWRMKLVKDFINFVTCPKSNICL